MSWILGVDTQSKQITADQTDNKIGSWLGTAVIGDIGDILVAANGSVIKITGSPTVVINGVKADVARTADAIKVAVCSAYNEAPAECGEVLDSSAVAAAGNC